jgi:hypothetical protein
LKILWILKPQSITGKIVLLLKLKYANTWISSQSDEMILAVFVRLCACCMCASELIVQLTIVNSLLSIQNKNSISPFCNLDFFIHFTWCDHWRNHKKFETRMVVECNLRNHKSVWGKVKFGCWFSNEFRVLQQLLWKFRMEMKFYYKSFLNLNMKPDFSLIKCSTFIIIIIIFLYYIWDSNMNIKSNPFELLRSQEEWEWGPLICAATYWRD